MRTLLNIYFPAGYAFSPDRPAHYHREPLERYAWVVAPTENDVLLYGEDDNVLVFDRVYFPLQEQINQLLAGNCYVVYQGISTFKVVSARLRTKIANTFRITATYAFPYESDDFRALLVGGEELRAGDAVLGVG